MSRRVAVLGLVAGCAATEPAYPLLPFDEATLTAWRELCGATLAVETGPRRQFSAMPLAPDTEEVRWRCELPGGIRAELIAETGTRVIGKLVVEATDPRGMLAGTLVDPEARASFVDQAARLLLPLVRPEHRDAVAVVVADLAVPPPKRACRFVLLGELDVLGCADDRPHNRVQLTAAPSSPHRRQAGRPPSPRAVDISRYVAAEHDLAGGDSAATVTAILTMADALLQSVFTRQDSEAARAIAQLETAPETTGWASDGANRRPAEFPRGVRVARGGNTAIYYYRERALTEQRVRHSKGGAKLILHGEQLAALPRNDLYRMLARFDVSAGEDQGVYDDVMWGWMRLNAELALGRWRAVPLRGADGGDAERSVDDPAIAAGAGLAGFLDVFVRCPQTLAGVTGCAVERIVVNSHPAVERVVRRGELSILATPVHRKIFISTMNRGGGRWAAGPSFVLTPDGATEILPGAATLAAIGSGRPTVADARRAVSLDLATAGATAVKELLERTRAKDVR